MASALVWASTGADLAYRISRTRLPFPATGDRLATIATCGIEGSGLSRRLGKPLARLPDCAKALQLPRSRCGRSGPENAKGRPTGTPFKQDWCER